MTEAQLSIVLRPSRADCKAIEAAMTTTERRAVGDVRRYAWAAWVECERMAREAGYGEISHDSGKYRSGHWFDTLN